MIRYVSNGNYIEMDAEGLAKMYKEYTGPYRRGKSIDKIVNTRMLDVTTGKLEVRHRIYLK